MLAGLRQEDCHAYRRDAQELSEGYLEFNLAAFGKLLLKLYAQLIDHEQCHASAALLESWFHDVDVRNEQALDRAERAPNEVRRSFARRTVAPPAATD